MRFRDAAAVLVMATAFTQYVTGLEVITHTITETATACQNTLLVHKAAEPGVESGLATSMQPAGGPVMPESTSTSWTTTTTTVGPTTYTSTISTVVARRAIMTLDCGCEINSKNGFIECPPEDEVPSGSCAFPDAKSTSTKASAGLGHGAYTYTSIHSNSTRAAQTVKGSGASKLTKPRSFALEAGRSQKSSADVRKVRTTWTYPSELPWTITCGFFPGSDPAPTLAKRGLQDDVLGDGIRHMVHDSTTTTFTFTAEPVTDAPGEDGAPASAYTIPARTIVFKDGPVYTTAAAATKQKRQDDGANEPVRDIPRTEITAKSLLLPQWPPNPTGIAARDENADEPSDWVPRTEITEAALIMPQWPPNPTGVVARNEALPMLDAAVSTSAPPLEPRQNANPCQMRYGCGSAYTTETISWDAANTVIGELTISYEAGTTTAVLYDNPKPGDGPPPGTEHKRAISDLYATYTTEIPVDATATATPYTGRSSKIICSGGRKQLMAAIIGVAFFAVLAFLL